MKTKTFNEEVWKLIAEVPKGKVTTYKEIAHKLGTKAYRAVGNGCNKNPNGAWNLEDGALRRKHSFVPCHRVVSSSGKIGGYAHGIKKKIEILRKEGVVVEKGKIKDFEKKTQKFKSNILIFK